MYLAKDHKAAKKWDKWGLANYACGYAIGSK